MNANDLETYTNAWNAHDIDTIMQYMTDDCVFETGAGSERYGTRFEGFETVKACFIRVWTQLPDVQFENGRYFAEGDRGCAEWTFTATKADGSKIEWDGCDLFTFVDGKIRVKATYMKNRR
jgi:ketosteroid isomerase-like protein